MIEKKENNRRAEWLRAFERLIDVQYRLRQDCPWDRKQTFESLRPNTIEEVYELADALARGDKAEIMKELGDVMEHVVFYAMRSAMRRATSTSPTSAIIKATN